MPLLSCRSALSWIRTNQRAQVHRAYPTPPNGSAEEPDIFAVQKYALLLVHVVRSDGLRGLRVVEFQRIRIEDEEAEALAVKAGDPGIQVENRLLLQGRTVVHDRLTLPAHLFKGLTQRRFRERPSTIYHLYQTEFGITVTQARERARAVAANRAAVRLLGLASGSSVLQVRRTALTLGDRPVEYRISTVNTAHHDVQLLSHPR